jgi:EAL domain-containing protein (putative c-di-GMP-specific phosphodiesterase class I)
MLMLGADAARRPNIGVINAATRQSVREALMSYSSTPAKPTTDLELSDVRAALETGSISARYQPIVRLSDRSLVGLEVLARLDHPVMGTVLPDQFVPQIEDAGLAEQLTEVIAQRAFADVTGPHMAHLDTLITINFPLAVLLRSEAVAVLERQCRAFGLPTNRVVVELTERTPVQDFAELRRAIEHVRTLGFQAAIDDVVPDLAGLENLLTIPFTSLKLDKDMVGREETDVKTLDFIRDTVSKAHANGLYVVAEGVETIAAWRQVRSLEVDAAQGFLIARPLPAAAVPAWLEVWERSADSTDS